MIVTGPVAIANLRAGAVEIPITDLNAIELNGIVTTAIASRETKVVLERARAVFFPILT